MRIAMVVVGTRGDVAPAIALGKALKSAGHHVRLVTGANFRPWVERHGLEAAVIRVDMQALLQSDLGRRWTGRGNNPLAETLSMRRIFNRHAPSVMVDAWQGCRDAELILSSAISDLFAAAVAEKTGAMQISCWPIPSLRATRNGAVVVGAPLPNRNSAINYAYGKLFLEPYPWLICGEAINRFRTEALHLPPQSRRKSVEALRHGPVLYGYSRHVVPHPADWPPNLHTTGYWLLDEREDWQPPDDLLAFIEAGEPPVYIGFGSMAERDELATTRLILEAVRRSGRRAVVLSGWAGIGKAEMPPDVLRLDYAPFSWLFPRMAAVVHHGGAGTTAEGLRAGVPSVVVPHIGDQSLWGARVHALGAGPRPIPRWRLTPSSLAAAIRLATSDRAMKQRAEELGARVRAEDGIAVAVGLIERYASSPS